ncbi:PrsW family intramembrane metalloprotease [Actinoalloteichus hymeniacidonis]|uniref:Membrane protein n=1 Tax=Actinoalloteichus hymeniacidonis TaxID=340345 RepID=A0AAC9HL32_9PSEU|nr:PrsW family intramembrane metalloprotease [Actinoalloteichus hymeniacidonis]AOS61180.1 putative membrane protein [Actinoalloteichus hymeniacidonis]MBB5910819.1 RsiW-degrading membrane proteinase PrsW (M82 family) [Actinoalloteichus hymeniacidonis]
MTSEHSSTSQRLTSSQASRWQRFLLPVLGVVILGLCGLTLLGLTHARVGAVALVVGAAAALLPLGPVIATFLWVDRWEPEPPRLLFAAFLWGACGATIAALLINDTAQVVGEVLLGTGGGDLVAALISAPLFEEAAKGLFVLAVLLRRRQEFNGIVDGIVYAGITGVGFAFTENITYFGLAFVQGGFGDMSGGVVAVFVLRGVLSPFTHSLFGAMLGIGLGIAACTSRPRMRIAAPLIGYLMAVLLHALWNGAATLGGGRIFINVYFLVMVPIFLSTALLVCWQRRREQHVVVTQLPGFAAEGWIAASEIGLLASLTSRKEWRVAVRKRSGASAGKAVAAYQLAVTELAFVRNQLAGGRTFPETAERLDQAVARLIRSRAAVLRSPGALADAARSTAGIRRRNRPSRGSGWLFDRQPVLLRALGPPRRPVSTEVTLPGIVVGSNRSADETLPIPKMVLEPLSSGAPTVRHDGVVAPVEPALTSAREPVIPAQSSESTDVTVVIDPVPPTSGEPKA